MKSDTNRCHRLPIDYRYQSINCYRLISINIDHRFHRLQTPGHIKLNCTHLLELQWKLCPAQTHWVSAGCTRRLEATSLYTCSTSLLHKYSEGHQWQPAPSLHFRPSAPAGRETRDSSNRSGAHDGRASFAVGFHTPFSARRRGLLEQQYPRKGNQAFCRV